MYDEQWYDHVCGIARAFTPRCAQIRLTGAGYSHIAADTNAIITNIVRLSALR